MSLVQAQWTLDSSVDSAISVSRGILHAATSDNVQPLALLACERFGGTLAMCSETCRKIEKTMLPTPPPAVLSFMRGVVGYSPHDCASQLGKSLAGVQFLGLATAMISSMDAYAAASAISEMLVASAADKTLLPTVPHLKALLLSLESRSHRAGFADDMVGWHVMLRNIPSLSDEQRRQFKEHGLYPSGEALTSIVDVFRQLARIGDTKVVRAVFTVDTVGAWLIAFTKWCLGAPPSVYLEDGTPVIEQPGHIVAIMLRSDTPSVGKLEILIEHSIGSPAEIVVPPAEESWRGMVTIESFGNLVLQNADLDRGTGLAAIRECLPYTVKTVLNRQICQENKAIPSSELMPLKTWPFRSNAAAAVVLQRVLGLDERPELALLGPELGLFDLPGVRRHAEEITKTCLCARCTGKETKPGHHDGVTCNKTGFSISVAYITSCITALSLFHAPEDLKVTTIDFTHDVGQIYRNRVLSQMLNPHTNQTISAENILAWAVQLVGHGDMQSTRHRERWAMSSANGQAVYPTIYDTGRITQHGYLSLSWYPGDLKFDSVKYSYVYAQRLTAQRSFPEFAPDTDTHNVVEPRNIFAGTTIEWLVRVKDESLSLGMSLKGVGIEKGHFSSSLPLAFTNISNAYVVPRCIHKRDAKREEVKPKCCYSTPPVTSPNKDCVNVVAVDGSDELRFYTMGHNLGTLPIIRGDACLDCCLEVAEHCHSDFLIL